jgi:hypothetical protein
MDTPEPALAAEWISAAEAVKILAPVFKSAYVAQMRICARAHAGLSHARAEHFKMDKQSEDNFDIPKAFWWAEGHEALEKNWEAGDFETWIDHKHRLRAFGVSFSRADMEKMIPATAAQAAQPVAAPVVGGRPPADWWDDLWIEICRQLYAGDLKPTKQADIESAMLQWLSDRGETPSTSTIRPRARKLWTAIQTEGGN